VREISFGLRTAQDFLQRKSFPRRDGRTVPNQDGILRAQLVSLIVYQEFLTTGNALASPFIDDPTRYGDGSCLVHETSLRD